MKKHNRSESKQEVVNVVQSLRAEPGTYALVIRLNRSLTIIELPSSASLQFP